MQKQDYELTWDLDSIFPGGSSSQELQHYIESIKKDMINLEINVKNFHANEISVNEDIIKIINEMNPLIKRFREASAFISCLSAQNVNDTKANLLVSERSELGAQLGSVQTIWNQKLAEISENKWNQLMKDSALQEFTFYLNECRNNAKQLLSTEKEIILNKLGIDGYHAWGQMYQTIVGKMTISIEENGKTVPYSIGQAANKLSSPDRNIRQSVFAKMQEAWQENADLFSNTLNHLAGFRLQTYKLRGWDNVLKEPLTINRMQQDTLDAMWTAITNKKKYFIHYFQKKARILGIDKMSFYDVGAPLSEKGQTYTYAEGANFIINHFEKFSPKMARFAEKAFEERWIEAEDRPAKRPGGFCTSFPASKQTRIFMTYSNSMSNVATLAHELGHAFHQHVMDDLPAMNQRYAKNVAETASTLAEMIVSDAAVQQAKTKTEKLSLLDDKLQRSIAFFMNIHARFLFETRFYKERKQGMVSIERLNELMENAQKEAYCDTLDEYDPTFWASKLHFHITGTPFYNFPYTFGYLFSLGIYAYAQEKGGTFEDDYIGLLKDTGRMQVEDLAMKHLQVDITKTDFWEHGIDLCIKDLEKFVELSK